MYTFGIDAASYQGVIDCAQLLADGHDFLIEKVTGEGELHDMRPCFPAHNRT